MNTTHLSAEPSDSHAADVESRIVNLLWQRGGPWLAKVGVRFRNGTVTLSGTVRSYYQRQLCNVWCRRVPGVHHVLDELNVDYESPVEVESPQSAGGNLD